MGDIKVVIAAIRRRGVETVVDRSWLGGLREQTVCLLLCGGQSE